ncbi:uncharacterized protein PG998_009015 [Apiospora kogelbergensis]|uniref:uncharacterized protein n=1 Tax=Apiospora kogelbergensis TaxID=1337665 RepID=UPI00312E0FE2
MNQGSEVNYEIQQLREALRQKELQAQAAVEAEYRAKQELWQYQSQFQQPQSSSPSNLDVPSPVCNEFQLSGASHMAPSFDQDAATSRRNSIPRNIGQGQVHMPAQHVVVQNTPRSSIRPNQDHPMVKRPRTMSQQAPRSHQMDRSTSNPSTRSAGAGPFVGGPITPPPKPSGPTMMAANNSNNMFDYTGQDESINHYASYSNGIPINRASSLRRHRSDMPTVNESIVMDPGAYIAMLPEEETYMPSSIVTHGQFDMEFAQYNAGNHSVCGSMTSAPTLDTAMSRDNSSFGNPSISHAMDRVNIQSQQSFNGMMPPMESPQTSLMGSGGNSPLGKRNAPCDEDLLAVGSNLDGQYYSTSAPMDTLFVAQDMSRSASNTSMSSIRSASSLSARAKETLCQQNMRSKSTMLKPKPASEIKAEAQQNSKKDGKTAITKAKYVRPKQPKVFCNDCTEHPEGFRGDHELRRHRDAKHPQQGVVRKWICVDPHSVGLPIGVPVVNPLDKCKACTSKKKYGAYYNAAAHLRRTHFKEKPSRAKNKSGGASRSEEEKRGGKGGGDWPPMPELKNWMKEIYVHQDELDATEEEDVDDEVSPIVGGGASLPPTEVEFASMGSVHHGYDNKMPEPVLTEIEYDFNTAPETINISPDNLPMYASHIPLSSANFTFSGSPMSPNFVAYMAAQNQMNGPPQYGSVVSSNDTVTPMTVFNDATDNFGDMHFDMAYPQ